jgi:hypothetical protein
LRLPREATSLIYWRSLFRPPVCPHRPRAARRPRSAPTGQSAAAGQSDMGRPTAQQQRRGRPSVNAQRQQGSAKVQRQGSAPTWTEPAAQADEARHPTKRGGKARRSKAQQHGHLSHGAIAKAKRHSDLAQRLQTLIADQFPPSWAAPPSEAQLLRAYSAAYGTLQPQHYGFKSSHALLKELLPEAQAPAAQAPAAKRRSPKPQRALAGPSPLQHGPPAQQMLLWRAPTVACRVHPQPTPSSQLHAQMLRFAELMLPDPPTLWLRREAVFRVTELAEETFPGCQASAAW